MVVRSRVKNRGRLARGYDIRVQRDGAYWMNEKLHDWGIEGELPPLWDQIKRDPTVVKAVIFLSTQRSWKPNKRRYADQYERGV